MDGWTILLTAIAVVALALTVAGWLWDRRRGVKRRRAMKAPPDREIPDFRPDEVVPEYLSELEARESSMEPGALALTAAERKRLTASLDGAPSAPVGWFSSDFVTDPADGWAVAPHPLVLVCADPVQQVRELYPVLEVAAPQGRPLVVVAPELAAEVVETLAVNHLRGNLRVIVLVAVAAQLDQLAEFVGATPVTKADLMAGYLPTESLGECGWWVSSRERSWVIDGGASDEPDQA